MVHYPGGRRNYKTVICGGHKQINMVSTLMLWYSNDDSLVLRSLKSLYFGSKSPGLCFQLKQSPYAVDGNLRLEYHP